MIGEWKKCSNGHYYIGEGACPHCPPSDSGNKRESFHCVKVCPNHHAYNSELDSCPICASTVVNDEYDFGHNTIECHSINLVGSVTIKVNGKDYYGVKNLFVYVSRGNKYRYCFSNGGAFMRDEICIEPDGIVQIGTSTMTGRELIKMCDLILDNQLSFLIHKRFTTTIEVDANDLIPF